MSPVITVENISKKYIIGHQAQERYTTLRDALANGAKRFTDKLRHPFAAPESDPTHEEFWALKDVSFDIQQGDRVGIIGRNGAGKSTLLKILSRITEPTSGKVSIKGRVASLLEVGTGFHPELTGRENVYLNGAILGMSKAEIKKKFDEIVAFAEVEKFLDTPVKRYSSGMYVRLAFAVAAHLEPEILIVDEVLAVGDAQFQKKCLGKMDDVGKEGRTVLFVSHNIAAINRLCTKCVYLEHGEVASIGTTSAVVESYLSAGFSTQSGEVIFTGGENEIIRMISARTVGIEGTPKSVFRSDEDIRVILTYQVSRQVAGLSVAVNILTPEQEHLWQMCDWEEYPELLENREPGIWTAEWIIPANILKPAHYFLSCGVHNQDVDFHAPGPFSFEITPEGTWRPRYKQWGVSGGTLAYKMKVGRPVQQGQANSEKV
jgi:lipopolysaccharide transport system ATP-binding protein